MALFETDFQITNFPDKPKDKTVYRTKSGVLFIYERSSNAWVRVSTDGSAALATPTSDGLMAASDLRKINRILVPYPRTTLSAAGCAGRFVSGAITITPLDRFIRVNGLLAVPGGQLPYRLTTQTAALDFGINKDALIHYLIDHDQLALRGSTGPRGRRGPRGSHGGLLDVGPKGPPGTPGSAPPCDLTIQPDVLDYQRTPGSNKAIVGMDVRQTSADAFIIVLQQGTIGNPSVRSDQLQVNCGADSSWVAALAPNTAGPIFYVDVSSLLDTIRAKYEDELRRLKQGHERNVRFWLSKLMSLFDEHKAALCCALFNCLKAVARIPKPRENFPQPLAVTTQSGLLAGFPQLADVPTLASAVIPAVPGAMWPHIPIQETAPALVVTDAGSTIDLEAGRYRVIIDQCCLGVDGQYVGDVRLTYAKDGQRRLAQYPRAGTFTQPVLAAHAYAGMALDIQHDGGPLSAQHPLAGQASGSVRLRFLRQREVLPDRTCVLTAQSVANFERAWEDGSGCAVVMTISGQDYIMVGLPSADQPRELTPFGNPAIAWPTLDGQTFMPLGAGPFRFKLDKSLNDAVAANLAAGAVATVRGCAGSSVVTGNVWVSKPSGQVITESFSVVLFPLE